MSSAALPSVPAPRTPWRRWALALALAIPVTAVYGALVTAVGRTLFLDEAQEAALHERVDDVPPTLLLWLLAGAAGLAGFVILLREILDARAARTEGREPVAPSHSPRRWAWPVIASGSPVASILLAAAVAGVAQHFGGGEPGAAALLFATLAGGWLLLIVAIGWVCLVVQTGTGTDEPKPVEGIEDSWFQKASSGAFWDVFPVTGVTALVVGFTDTPVDGVFLLLGVAIVAQVDFAVRLWLLRRREERA